MMEHKVTPASQLPQGESLRTFLSSQSPLIQIIGKNTAEHSLLVQHLCERLSPHKDTIFLKAQDISSPTHLQNIINQKMNIQPANKTLAFEQQLCTIIAALQQQLRSCILVITDGHLLSYASLAALSHLSLLQENKTISLHLILSGKIPLMDKMADIQLRPSLIINLGDLDPASTYKRIHSLIEETSLLEITEIAPLLGMRLKNRFALMVPLFYKLGHKSKAYGAIISLLAVALICLYPRNQIGTAHLAHALASQPMNTTSMHRLIKEDSMAPQSGRLVL